MKWIIVAVAVLVGIVLLVVLVGAMLPRHHVSSRAAAYKSSPQQIWDVITSPQKFPSWRNGVKRVEMISPVQGRLAWREIDSHGAAIPYEIVESAAPQRLVTRIADPRLPFGGTWTYELSPAAGDATVLRITENGEVYNPIFRFVSRFFMGYSGTQEQYLRDLGDKFGQQVNVEN